MIKAQINQILFTYNLLVFLKTSMKPDAGLIINEGFELFLVMDRSNVKSFILRA